MRSTPLLTRAGSIVLVATLALAACGGGDDPVATVAFAEPPDGATVHGGVRLAMTADGVTIEEAGEARDGAAGVRASPREHVNTALAFAANIGRAFTTAADEDAAFSAVEELYHGAPDGFVEELPGADWIQDTCGIDLED